MGNVHVVGPNEAAIISGGCGGKTKKRTIVGGWAWVWLNVSNVQKLSLNLMTMIPRCDMVETIEGVPLTVTGVAQCKISSRKDMLKIASEQLLGKPVRDIQLGIQLTLEGHLRSILGTLSVEEVYKDREKFAWLVWEVASADMANMGIEILSFVIRDIDDEVGYLKALGKSRTAVVRRDADIGVAQANRDAGIREAECEKEAMDVVYSTDTMVEDNSRMFQLQKARFDTEVNAAKAEAQLAYQLQEARLRQEIRNEQIQIDVVERKKEIEVEEKEVIRKERDLEASVKLPAEAESYNVRTIAEGRRTAAVEVATAEGEKIKLIGIAQAQALEGVGKAQAEMMRAKAQVYKQYKDAAILSLVLDVLPKIASEVSMPLSKTDEIVLLGGSDRVTCEVNRVIGQIPPSVRALAGVDLAQLLRAACSCPECEGALGSKKVHH